MIKKLRSTRYCDTFTIPGYEGKWRLIDLPFQSPFHLGPNGTENVYVESRGKKMSIDCETEVKLDPPKD